MSSEKRSITPYTFYRLVPPLKTICSLSCESAKSLFRIQQTQKSFSTTTALMPSRVADSLNRSRLSEADPVAILSMRLLLGDLLDRCIDPTCSGLRIGENFLSQLLRQPCPDLRDHLWRDAL